jgi:hypothetical protein
MFLYPLKTITAEASDGAVKGVRRRPLTCWDCGFKSRRGHRYLSLRECYVLSGTDVCVGPSTHTGELYRV